MSLLHKSRYVERVRAATSALLEDLLEANRRLCLAIAVLGQGRDDSALGAESIDERLSRWRNEQSKLLELLESADREFKSFEEQAAAVEQQNSSLATLFAAVSVLHSSLELQTVVSSIEEIVTNLIGSEQFAVVRSDEALTPLSLFGVNDTHLCSLTLGSGIIGRAATEGRPLVMSGALTADPAGIRVCVPLIVEAKTLGFLLIFGFLPQKKAIQPLDHELFALVGSHAAAALYSAELSAQQKANR